MARRLELARRIGVISASVPFVGPEALERKRGRPFRARLGANESAFGPSLKVLAAMQTAALENWKYSDPENFDLRTAIARHHGVAALNVVIGEGIDGLLGLSVMMMLEPGEAVVTSDGAYPTFNFHVAAHSGRLIKVSYRDGREDLEALLAAAKRENARIIYVSNPDSPMATWWPAQSIKNMIERLPDGVLLLLDEAYYETGPAAELPPVEINHPQVLRFRTFSKAYGMAGARIGYALGEESTIRTFEKLRNHYGINRIGQVAALAAIEDQAYLAGAVQKIAAARDRISLIAVDQGLTPVPSATNFVAIDSMQDAAFAKRLLDELAARDVFVRMPIAAPINRCIRVSAGLDRELDIFAEELPRALKAARG